MTSIFIPGRLESERLPYKLLLPVNKNEESLWEIACAKLEALLTPKTRFALCYDEPLIEIASTFNIEIIKRSKESAIIDEPLVDVFGDIDVIDDDKIVFLNPCMSKLKLKTIDSAIDWFDKEDKFKDATSVTSFNNWVYDAFGNLLTPLDYTALSTKDMPIMFKAAHCFHMFDKNTFLEDGQMLHENHGMFFIPPEECIDVDTQLDLKILRALNGCK